MSGERVKLVECPRDAWQGLPKPIPTELKANYLRALIAAGFKHIDAVSFVSPKTVPQMADSEQVLAQLSPIRDVEIIGIVVNEKGAERAIATGEVTTLGFPCSISETFLQRNQNQSLEENMSILQEVSNRAEIAGLDMVVYISMAFGNPYGDPWSEARVAAAARIIVELDIDISLADTIGAASPELIQHVFLAVSRECDCEIGVHLHSTPADAVAKILAAFDGGCRRFDSAIGGLGGCPFAQDALVGNIPTESVIDALSQRGVNLPNRALPPDLLAMNSRIATEFA